MSGERQTRDPDGVATAGHHPRLDGLLEQAFTQSMPAALYLVATPIGNLADITVRAVAILSRADAVYCEDTRITRRLFDAFGVNRPLAVYHDHNGEVVRPQILEHLAGGRTVALVSDAGMPLISDPGYKLVREVIDAGFDVIAIPGASASVTALAVSSLPAAAFLFTGFLPAKTQARRKRLGELAGVSATLVLYESPNRLAGMLSDAADILGAREAAVARELTKRFEEVRRGALADLAVWADTNTPKGEIAVVIGPAATDSEGDGEVSDDIITERLAAALESQPLSKAARDVSDALGVPRGRVYALGLAMKRQPGSANRNDDGGDEV